MNLSRERLVSCNRGSLRLSKLNGDGVTSLFDGGVCIYNGVLGMDAISAVLKGS